MRLKKQLMMVLGAFTLLSSTAYGLGVQIGPFDFGLGRYRGTDAPRAVSYDPICTAIARRMPLEMNVEWFEKVSNEEKKITTKRIVIEPYLFGKKKDGQLILRGNVVSEKLVKEVTIKRGEGASGEIDINEDGPADEATYAGTYSSTSGNGVNTLNIQRVSGIRVLDKSFDPPKDFNEVFKDDVAVVICTVNSTVNEPK